MSIYGLVCNLLISFSVSSMIRAKWLVTNRIWFAKLLTLSEWWIIDWSCSKGACGAKMWNMHPIRHIRHTIPFRRSVIFRPIISCTVAPIPSTIICVSVAAGTLLMGKEHCARPVCDALYTMSFPFILLHFFDCHWPIYILHYKFSFQTNAAGSQALFLIWWIGTVFEIVLLCTVYFTWPNLLAIPDWSLSIFIAWKFSHIFQDILLIFIDLWCVTFAINNALLTNLFICFCFMQYLVIIDALSRLFCASED